VTKDKAGDFIRLSEKRLPNVLEALRIYTHLANRGAYTYTPEQLDVVFGQIDTAVAESKAAFGIEQPFPDIQALTPEDGAKIRDLIENPPPPTEKLKEIFRDYKANQAAVAALEKPEPLAFEDPAYTLLDWKADPTPLPYAAWVAEKLRELEDSVPEREKAKWRR